MAVNVVFQLKLKWSNNSNSNAPSAPISWSSVSWETSSTKPESSTTNKKSTLLIRTISMRMVLKIWLVGMGWSSGLEWEGKLCGSGWRRMVDLMRRIILRLKLTTLYLKWKESLVNIGRLNQWMPSLLSLAHIWLLLNTSVITLRDLLSSTCKEDLNSLRLSSKDIRIYGILRTILLIRIMLSLLMLKSKITTITTKRKMIKIIKII